MVPNWCVARYVVWSTRNALARRRTDNTNRQNRSSVDHWRGVVSADGGSRNGDVARHRLRPKAARKGKGKYLDRRWAHVTSRWLPARRRRRRDSGAILAATVSAVAVSSRWQRGTEQNRGQRQASSSWWVTVGTSSRLNTPPRGLSHSESDVHASSERHGKSPGIAEKMTASGSWSGRRRTS